MARSTERTFSHRIAEVATAAKGELKIALGFDFPAKIDALKDTHLAPYGMLESLMRPDTAE